MSSQTLLDYCKSTEGLKEELEKDAAGWVAKKIGFVEEMRSVIMGGVTNIEHCFKWCDSVWSSTKHSIEGVVERDAEIGKLYNTKLAAEFLGEGKYKELEKDVHVEDRNSPLEDYTAEALEIIDQHKKSHAQLIQSSTNEVQNSVLKPLNGNRLDFTGTHHPKFKALETKIINIRNDYQRNYELMRRACAKFKTVLASAKTSSRQGQPVANDPIKSLLRIHSRILDMYKNIHDMSDLLCQAWKDYQFAATQLNASLQKTLILFYSQMQKYAFPENPSTKINPFDSIAFQEPDLTHHMESIFNDKEIIILKKYSEKPGIEGFAEATHSDHIDFVTTFGKYLGHHWVDRRDSSDTAYLFVNVSPDLYVNVFQCIDFQGKQVPSGRAIISDRADKISTKKVDWKKELQISGRKPGSWFSSGKANVLMNNDEEVKDLTEQLDDARRKLKSK